MEWMDRAVKALRKAKMLAKAKDDQMDALRAQNAALRARAEAAEKEAEFALHRSTELQELLDETLARNERGDRHNLGSFRRR